MDWTDRHPWLAFIIAGYFFMSGMIVAMMIFSCVLGTCEIEFKKTPTTEAAKENEK